MIRFSRRRGDVPVARVSCTWTLTREEVAWCIIAAIEPHTYEDLAAPRTKRELEKAVRDLLARNADKREWWADAYKEEYPGEPTPDEVEAWGIEQASRL